MHNINGEIACRKIEQKYQVTIGLKFTTQSTKASEERELQLNKKTPIYIETRWKTNSNFSPFVIRYQKGRKVRTNAPEEFLHDVEGGARTLLGLSVVVGPAAVSSKCSALSISHDE